jgi:hypothetical protein
VLGMKSAMIAGLRGQSPGRAGAPVCDRRFDLARVSSSRLETLLFTFSGGIESMMKLYVGNLSFRTTDDQLRSTFEQYGEVASASVVMDRETGRSRGFGFVEMSNDEEAKAAINALHGQQLEGRNLTVNEAKPREAGGGRGGFGGGGGGGGGGRRGGGGGGW